MFVVDVLKEVVKLVKSVKSLKKSPMLLNWNWGWGSGEDSTDEGGEGADGIVSNESQVMVLLVTNTTNIII